MAVTLRGAITEAALLYEDFGIRTPKSKPASVALRAQLTIKLIKFQIVVKHKLYILPLSVTVKM